MSATELLCTLINIDPLKLSSEECQLLEATFFTEIYNQLKEMFRNQYLDYFRLMKFSSIMEDTMLEENFIRLIINDILVSGEYNLSGISRYTAIPEDVLYELASGSNPNPTLTLSRRLIELHKSVRPDIYRIILQKVTLNH